MTLIGNTSDSTGYAISKKRSSRRRLALTHSIGEVALVCQLASRACISNFTYTDTLIKGSSCNGLIIGACTYTFRSRAKS